jgi:hypothetical protein
MLPGTRCKKMERGDDAKTAFVTASIMLGCNNLVA